MLLKGSGDFVALSTVTIEELVEVNRSFNVVVEVLSLMATELGNNVDGPLFSVILHYKQIPRETICVDSKISGEINAWLFINSNNFLYFPKSVFLVAR